MLEKRTFQLGVDTDSSLTGVEQGFARWMVNCFIDNGVDLSNIKGNLEMQFESSFTFFTDNPLYTYKCIGSKYDPTFQKNYFFVISESTDVVPVYNSFIFEYDVNTGIINVVCDYYWYLGFEWDELITGISIAHIDTTTPLLYWSQRAGLRKINVLKAKLAYASGFTDPDGYLTSGSQIVELIKAPPRFRPEITQYTDVNKNFNKIGNKYFQFAYAYVYDDYEVSVGSPISDVNTREYNQAGRLYYKFPYDFKGYLITDKNFNNTIELTLNSGSNIVKKIQILYREKTSDNGLEVNYDWYLYDTVIKSENGWNDNTDYQYVFYNEKIPLPIEQKVANALFSNVPLSAKALNFAEDSRLYLANITENYDLEQINITAIPKYNKVGVFCDFTSANQFTQNEGTNLVVLTNPVGFVLPVTPPQINSVIRIGIKPLPPGTTDYYYLYYQIKPEDLLNYPSRLNQSIVNAINENPGYNGIHSYLNGSVIQIFNSSGNNVVDYVYNQTPTSNNFSQLKSFRGFKTGQTHNLGIFYRDKGGRMSSVQEFAVDIPFFTQAALNETINQELYNFISIYATIQLQINHIPPIWADRYSIAYGKPSFGTYYQFKVIGMTITSTGTLKINVDFFTNYPLAGQTYLDYSFSEGDTLRMIGLDEYDSNKSILPEVITSLNLGGNGLTATVLEPGSPPTAYDSIQFGANWASNPLTVVANSIDSILLGSAGKTTIFDNVYMFLGFTNITYQYLTKVYNSDYDEIESKDLPTPPVCYSDVLYFKDRQYITSLTEGVYSNNLPSLPPDLVLRNNGLLNFEPNCLYRDGDDIYIGCNSSSGIEEVWVSVYEPLAGIPYWNPYLNIIGYNVITLIKFGNDFYAGTLGGGVYTSASGGNWAAINSGLTNLNVYSITKLTFDGTEYIFAVTDDGVFKTADNANWVISNSGIPNTFITNKILTQGTTLIAGSIKVDIPTHTNAGEKYVYVSVDGGNVWFKWQDITQPDIFFNNSFTGNTLNTSFDYLVEVPVISKIDETYVEIDYNDNLYQSYLDGGNKIYVEIFKKAEQINLYNELISYEIGDAGLPTRYHTGNIQNQDYFSSPNPAIVDLTNGNTFYRKRPMSEQTSYFIEDANYSDIPSYPYTSVQGTTNITKNGSAVTNLGRPNIVNKTYARITRQNTIWYSDTLTAEINYNGLSSLYDGQFKDYSQNFGSIQKLFSTDTMLKVFMEQRVGYIPINRYLTGGGGNALTLNNDTVLTKMEYYQELRGVGKHPESHAHFSGADYFVDPITGAICRISRDGITVISDTKNGQGNYTIRKFLYNAIKNHAGNFYGGFNERRNSYEVIIGDSVIVWDEQKNSFSGARSYAGEMLGNAGIDLLSFKNGRLYLHEANQVYNNFFNRQFNSEVWVVGNQELVNKVYTTLRLKSTTPWAAEISNDRGQFSILIENNFTPREKVWYAQIKRDMNTVNVTPPAIINGIAIRDIAILIRLINSNIENEQIKYVEINQVISN